jgi:hypothetical protein
LSISLSRYYVRPEDAKVPPSRACACGRARAEGPSLNDQGLLLATALLSARAHEASEPSGRTKQPHLRHHGGRPRWLPTLARMRHRGAETAAPGGHAAIRPRHLSAWPLVRGSRISEPRVHRQAPQEAGRDLDEGPPAFKRHTQVRRQKGRARAHASSCSKRLISSNFETPTRGPAQPERVRGSAISSADEEDGLRRSRFDRDAGAGGGATVSMKRAALGGLVAHRRPQPDEALEPEMKGTSSSASERHRNHRPGRRRTPPGWQTSMQFAQAARAGQDDPLSVVRAKRGEAQGSGRGSEAAHALRACPYVNAERGWLGGYWVNPTFHGEPR